MYIAMACADSLRVIQNNKALKQQTLKAEKENSLRVIQNNKALKPVSLLMAEKTLFKSDTK